MKILAAHAVWGLILARRAWWPDQRDRVVPRYAAQVAVARFAYRPGFKTRVERGNLNRMLLAVPARLATAFLIALGRLLGSACLCSTWRSIRYCLHTQWTRALIFGKLHPKQQLDVLNELDSKKSQPFAPR